MNDVETLRKYKELLDNNIITPEEFAQKKREILEGDMPNSSEAASVPEQKPPRKVRINQKLAKKITILIGILAILVAGGIGIRNAVENAVEKDKQSKRAAALQAEIQPIMSRYGMYGYEVKYVNGRYDVFAMGFESLTNGDALDCLKELDSVYIDDPCGEENQIDFRSPHIHPGLDVPYSYWKVNSAQFLLNQMYGGAYSTPGIYCDRYGTECVYACEN